MSLIDRVRQGDKEAILEFYRLYAPRIERYLQRKLPKAEDAEEILNDVFLDALDELPLLKHTTYIQAWLYKIAHNKTVDYYRKKKIKSVLLSQLPFLELAAKEMTEPEFLLEKERIRERFDRALAKLSEKYQQILRMHYEQGMKIKEIAIALQMTFKATESMLYRARQQFMREYQLSL